MDDVLNSTDSKIKSKQVQDSNYKVNVYFDKFQWLYESMDYILIIWGNKIEQYFITQDLNFFESFHLKLNQYVLGAFQGSTELLCVLLDSYEVVYLSLNKLRYALDTIKDLDKVMEKKEKFTISGTTKILIGEDTAKKSICVFADQII